MGGGCVNMDYSKKKPQSINFVVNASFAILSYPARVTAGKVGIRLAGSWSWKHCDSQFDQFLSFWALLLAIMGQIPGFLRQIHPCWCCFLPSSFRWPTPKRSYVETNPPPLSLGFWGGIPMKKGNFIHPWNGAILEWNRQFGMGSQSGMNWLKWPFFIGTHSKTILWLKCLLFTRLRLCPPGIRSGRPFIEQVSGLKWWKKTAFTLPNLRCQSPACAYARRA